MEKIVLFGESRRAEQGKGKAFFFEKKQQKAFDRALAGPTSSRRQGSKVFWFFFSKKNVLPSLHQRRAAYDSMIFVGKISAAAPTLS